VLAAVTSNCRSGWTRSPFFPASVNVSPAAIIGTAGASLFATSVSRVAAVGAASPPTVVSSCEFRMLAPAAAARTSSGSPGT
jgi:hypothetical protein